ncbi:MAG: DUF6036 family nucleotidyltransferase [Streptosporangiaceae bacterium]|nr:hypothetical protein [Actinomycetota bacterium]
MTREQLEHVLRAAARIADDPDVLVIGSQSVLGSFTEDELPVEATASMEADVAFFGDPEETKADLVDGAIGELSDFHETFGFYAQGVSVTTAVLPEGWRDRVVTFVTPATAPGRGLCLEPHDCVVSKLVAGREKDLVFASALVRAGLINLDTLAHRIETVDAHPLVIERMRSWISGHHA